MDRPGKGCVMDYPVLFSVDNPGRPLNRLSTVPPDQLTAANVAISWVVAVRAFHKAPPERISTTTRIPR
jgi:hypothetical protein